MNKTMGAVILEEAKGLSEKSGGFVYCDKPYSCGYVEAAGHFAPYQVPENMTIERGEKEVRIMLKPLKGSAKRKVYTIRLWVA